MNYWSIETNIIQSRDNAPDEIKNKIPEWALYFKWIVSNGDKNRNWYIIDVNAWFINKWKYIKDFLKSWSVLYGHDSDKPIWRPLTFELVDNQIEVSWYVYDDVYTNWAIWRWLILGLSTGHITHSSLWRNSKNGSELSEKEFSQKIWKDDDLWDEFKEGLWDWVVTWAEIVEYSFVTTPSNRKSVLNESEELMINSISEKYGKDSELVKKLYFNWVEMTKEMKDKLAEEQVETNKVETLTNEVETLKNELEETKTNLETSKNEIVSLKTNVSELETAKNKLEAENNELREKLKKEVETMANVVVNNAEDKTPKGEDVTMDNILDKYSK